MPSPGAILPSNVPVGLRNAIDAIIANQTAGVNLGDQWRIIEGNYPTPQSPKCVLLQFNSGDWTTVRAFNPDGSDVLTATQTLRNTGQLAAQFPWVLPPALANGWVQYGSSNYPWASARLCRETGIVRLRGLIGNGTPAYDTSIPFSVPSGGSLSYVPDNRIVLASDCTSGHARVDVRSIDGAVNPASPASAQAYLSLDLSYVSASAQTWIAPTFQNGWVNYSGLFNPAGYTKLPTGRVHLRGLIASGTVGPGVVVFNLPVGYRPAYTCIFGVGSGTTDGHGRVDVYANGNVVAFVASNTYVSFDGISFLEASQEYLVTPLTGFAGSWQRYPGYNPPGIYCDPFGQVYVRGLIRSGASGAALAIPYRYAPSQSHIFCADSGNNSVSGAHARVDVNLNGWINANTTNNIYVSLDGVSWVLNG